MFVAEEPRAQFGGDVARVVVVTVQAGCAVIHAARAVIAAHAGAGGGTDTVRWDPAAGTIDAAGLEGIDAVVHLAGIVGTFPSLNARTTAELDAWLTRIGGTLDAARRADPARKVGPYGVNVILHPSNTRVEADLDCLARHRVPIVITSVGKPEAVVKAVHGWGGLVFHDVTTMKFARKALECGVDGLVLVCAGAGGHGGTMNPFAFIEEVRAEYDGTVLLAGAMSTGRAVRAALERRGIEFAQLHGDELQSLLFESGHDRANQLAFDGIGLEKDEGSVAHALQATAQGRAGTTHHVQRSGDENRVVLARDRQRLCARLFDACAFEHLVAAHRACGGCKHGRLEAAW